jgi:hypothetical protein
MKTFLTLIILIFICSCASAQSAPRGDTCANCSVERSDPQRDLNAQRNRPQTGNEWPVRPQVAKSTPPKYTVFKTNFLVNNESDKEIRSIKWTATLINRETQETIQSFPLETKRKIAPHKSSKLKERLVLPLKKLQGRQFQPHSQLKTDETVDEKYEIVEILYADKSVSKP